MAVLGIDIGTGGSRAVVVDGDGRVLASSTERHAPFESPETGWAEQASGGLVARRAGGDTGGARRRSSDVG